ncbi:MAG: penicillin-binding protein 1C [Alphaproteobacteria bacterium]|nr:penicillin-binding protein 1C [Alphaproteobacteria bacterium]
MSKKTLIIIKILIAAMLFFIIAAMVPRPRFYDEYGFSAAAYDRNNRLLKIRLSLDEKYRLFTPIKEVPQDLKKALLLYEDRAFYYHFGVNPLSIGNALFQMMKGQRTRGASTITMQVARMVYHLDSSTVSGKIMQMLRAVQIEMFYDKDEILEAYFNLAPYGGNIEGIGAASLIYFGVEPQKLSLPQIMALTVIPQNPEKRNLLKEKGRHNNKTARNRLSNIWQKHYNNPQNRYLDLDLAVKINLPDYAPHFARKIMRSSKGKIRTTLDLDYQLQIENIVRSYVDENAPDGVYNAAALVLDAESMEVLAYVGSKDFYNERISGQVDGIMALRSGGSVLKPFIYAIALEKGLIHPLSMLKDVPKNYGLYTPENFDHSFYGLIDATHALIYSRNIPAVELLLKIDLNSFYKLLKDVGVKKLKEADYYGLALALGGAEISMQNVAEMYAMLYNGGKFRSMVEVRGENSKQEKPLIMPEAAFLVWDMLRQNEAIEGMSSVDYPVAWKTGTSHGFRDAWSAGLAGKYAVVVWVGNFDGTANHKFVGRDIAAPLFFKIVRLLMKENVYRVKNTSLNLAEVEICRDTGDIAVEDCDNRTVSRFIPNVTSIKISDITRKIPINLKTGLRACRHTPPETVMKSYNFWPSDIIKAYSDAGVYIKRPPEFGENCEEISSHYGNPPQIVAPLDETTFWLHSEDEKIAAKANADADADMIYWFVNNRLVTSSRPEKTVEIRPNIGTNEIKAVDNLGRQAVVRIKALLRKPQ